MDRELLKQAQDALAIREVYLAHALVRTKDEFFPFGIIEQLQVQFKNHVTNRRSVESDVEGKKVIVHVFDYAAAFRMLPVLSPDELKDATLAQEKTVAEVAATFCAVYETEVDIPEAALEEFGKYNVGYHVWPYWREYASSTGMRMRLPQFAVPMYRVPQSAEPTGETKA